MIGVEHTILGNLTVILHARINKGKGDIRRTENFELHDGISHWGLAQIKPFLAQINGVTPPAQIKPLIALIGPVLTKLQPQT